MRTEPCMCGALDCLRCHPEGDDVEVGAEMAAAEIAITNRELDDWYDSPEGRRR